MLWVADRVQVLKYKKWSWSKVHLYCTTNGERRYDQREMNLTKLKSSKSFKIIRSNKIAPKSHNQMLSSHVTDSCGFLDQSRDQNFQIVTCLTYQATFRPDGSDRIEFRTVPYQRGIIVDVSSDIFTSIRFSKKLLQTNSLPNITW